MTTTLLDGSLGSDQRAIDAGGLVFVGVGVHGLDAGASTPHGGAAGDVSVAYFDDDAVASLTQNGQTTTYGRDVTGRRSMEVSGPTGGDPTRTVARHYTDSSDNPGWIDTNAGGTTTWTRFAETLGGDLGFTIDSAGATQLQVADLHGDVVATVDVPAAGPAAGISGWSDADEYGNPQAGGSAGVGGVLGYHWLGAKQRATDPSGLILMGARLYNPVTGSFTSVDPVPGGNSTAYAYPQDPINQFDLNGQWGWRSFAKAAVIVGGIAGAVACGASVVCGIAVGAAAGAAAYAASNAGTRRWSTRGFVASAALGGLTGGVGAKLSGISAAKTAAKSCSFTGTTLVLMADGSKKPIDQIQVGDLVLATDPETGEQAARRVEAVFVHYDTVVDLTVAGERIVTTEDHPFWSVTDRVFERADQLAPGELVLAADGRILDVAGLALESAREALAYNLAVEGIHTYHVGQSEILVHNTCGKYVRELQGGVTRTYGKFSPAKKSGEMAGARYVKETGPRGTRGWMETYDHSGRVRIVHPKNGNYPHYTFGPGGNYTGARP